MVFQTDHFSVFYGVTAADDWYLDYLYTLDGDHIEIEAFTGGKSGLDVTELAVPATAVINGTTYHTILNGPLSLERVDEITGQDHSEYYHPELYSGTHRSYSPWILATALEKLCFEEGVQTTDAGYLFCGNPREDYREDILPNGLAHLKTILGLGPHGLNITQDSVYMMFGGCVSLETVDYVLQPQTTELENLFRGCSSLRDFSFLEGWDTSHVDDLDKVFRETGVEEIDLTGWDVSNVTEMGALFKDCPNLRSVNLSGWDVSHVTDMHEMFDNDYDDNEGRYLSSLTQINISGWDAPLVTDIYEMFSGNPLLTNGSIIGLESFHAPNAENFENMFEGCQHMTEIDLSGIQSTKAESFRYMFSDCSHLQSVDMTGIETGNVTTFYKMFAYCEDLTQIKGSSSWDFSSAESVERMFYDCYALSSVDMTFNFSDSLSTMYRMFRSCEGLEAIDFTGADFSGVTTIKECFKGCENLTTIGGTFNFSSALTDASSFLYHCDVLQEIDLSASDFSSASTGSMLYGTGELMHILTPYKTGSSSISMVNTLYAKNKAYAPYSSIPANLTESLNLVNTTAPITWGIWQDGRLRLNNQSGNYYVGSDRPTKANGTLEIWGYFDDRNEVPKTASDQTKFAWMDHTSSITHAYIDIQTSAEDLSGFICGCGNLTDISVAPTCRITGVTNLSGAFSDNENLQSVQFFEAVSSRSVTNVQGMFQGDASLTEVDFENLYTKNITDASSLFKGCSGIEEITFYSDSMHALTGAQEMFSGCSSLETLNMPGTNFDHIVNAHGMFKDCENLETIDGIEDWEFRYTTDMSQMFYGCESLQEISRFQVSNPLTTAEQLFYNCSSLEQVDFSDQDMDGVTNLSGAFYGCSSLNFLDLHGTTMINIENAEDCFTGCDNLKRIWLPDDIGGEPLMLPMEMLSVCYSDESSPDEVFYNRVIETYGEVDNIMRGFVVTIDRTDYTAVYTGESSSNTRKAHLFAGLGDKELSAYSYHNMDTDGYLLPLPSGYDQMIPNGTVITYDTLCGYGIPEDQKYVEIRANYAYTDLVATIPTRVLAAADSDGSLIFPTNYKIGIRSARTYLIKAEIAYDDAEKNGTLSMSGDAFIGSGLMKVIGLGSDQIKEAPILLSSTARFLPQEVLQETKYCDITYTIYSNEGVRELIETP